MESYIYSSVLALLLALTPAGSYAQHSQDIFYPAVPFSDIGVNARETPAGPVLLGMPLDGMATPEEALQLINELQTLEVHAILGFHPADPDILEALSDADIEYVFLNFHWWRGPRDNPWADPWMPVLDSLIRTYSVHNIAIHCQHGVDRTGNAMAYLLAVYYKIPIADALYMVVANTNPDTMALADVLEEYGVYDRRPVDGHLVNLYGFENNGMHTDEPGYQTYLRYTIDSAIEAGAAW